MPTPTRLPTLTSKAVSSAPFPASGQVFLRDGRRALLRQMRLRALPPDALPDPQVAQQPDVRRHQDHDQEEDLHP